MSADWLETVRRERMVPVLVLDDPARAEPLGAALTQGGITTAEVTLRTAAALECVRRLADRPELIVGAGTVVTADQVDDAVAAGARFVVCPGLSAAVVRRCTELGVPVVPGVATATEVMQALDLGLEVLKFFPAATSGGVAGVKALAGPFPNVRFVPTGGIGPRDAADYLALPNVVAVGGSWLAPGALLADGDFETIAARAAEARALGLGAHR